MEHELLIGLLLFFIAFLYSSVGHGGASGYLAVLGVLGYDINSLRFSALFLNVLVSSVSFMNFLRKKYFDLEIFISLAVGSIPMAYLGAKIEIDAVWYYRILAACLVIAAWRLSGIFTSKSSIYKVKKYSFFIFIAIGALIGLLSGMIGIGGGILLSPLLLLLKATDTKTCSGISALFILVNSLAGIAGGFQSTGFNFSINPIWIVAAVIGGLLGAYWGSSLARPLLLRRILAIVLLIASIKMAIIK